MHFPAGLSSRPSLQHFYPSTLKYTIFLPKRRHASVSQQSKDTASEHIRSPYEHSFYVIPLSCIEIHVSHQLKKTGKITVLYNLIFTFSEHTNIKNLDRMLATIFRVLETSMIFIQLQTKYRILTQHSLNCLASIGDVKLRPHVSLVIGSFQYTKHSDACPIRVPVRKKILTVSKWSILCVSGSLFGYLMCMSIQIDKFKHRQSVARAVYTDNSEKSITDFVENQKILSRSF